MPRPVEALPCGSLSISSTRSPTAASAVPRLMAVVVLPTPPFWLATTSTRSDRSDLAGTTQPPHANDAPPRVTQRCHDVGLILPISCSFFQLRRNILSFEEEPQRPSLEVGPGIPEQAPERRTSPRGDDVHSQIEVFRTVVPHRRRQVQRLDHLGEEAATLGHALDEV